jgi:hypothetical protein
MPTVLNRHHFRRREFPAGSLYVGRPGTLATQILAEHPELTPLTALGNPFHHHRIRDPARVLDLYRRWLWRMIEAGDRAVLEALHHITAGSYLVCSCVRLDGTGACHAKVIAQAWRWWSGAAVEEADQCAS